jgi:hypothetical protein
VSRELDGFRYTDARHVNALGDPKMTTFKTWLFAAAAVLGVTTNAVAETEMEQVGHWLNELGPKLEPTRAGPDLTKCEGRGNLKCKQRLIDEQLASLQNLPLFLDQNPAPKCLQDTEGRIRHAMTTMEITFKFVRNNLSGRSDVSNRQKWKRMTDLLNQSRKDVVAQARRDSTGSSFPWSGDPSGPRTAQLANRSSAAAGSGRFVRAHRDYGAGIDTLLILRAAKGL